MRRVVTAYLSPRWRREQRRRKNGGLLLSMSLVSFFRSSESRSHHIPRRSVGRSVGRSSASHDGTISVGLSLSDAAAATAQSTRPSSPMTPYLPRWLLHWLWLLLPSSSWGPGDLKRYLPTYRTKFLSSGAATADHWIMVQVGWRWSKSSVPTVHNFRLRKVLEREKEREETNGAHVLKV